MELMGSNHHHQEEGLMELKELEWDHKTEGCSIHHHHQKEEDSMELMGLEWDHERAGCNTHHHLKEEWME